MSWKAYFKDIRFWIILFFIVRLIGITNAPLEVGHTWRQVTVNMVARNFLEIDNNILYPRIDFAGEKTGITGMEFPVFNYMIYGVSKLFGYQHWYGRLLNLIFSSIGILFFFKLIRKYFTKEVAFNASIILIFSIWFQYSRKIMPDTFSASCVIMSLYYAGNYLEARLKKAQVLYLIAFFLLITVGVLSKLPTGFLLILLALFILSNKYTLKRKVILSIVTILGVVPVVLWYFYWVPFLVEKYDFWHFFMGKSFQLGFKEIMENLPDTVKKFYNTAIKFVGFAAFLFGFTFAIIKKQKLVLAIFTLSFLAYLIIVFKAGYTFPKHSYYIVPFVPIMALVAGYGLAQIKIKKYAILILCCIAIEGIANQQHDFFIKDKDLYYLEMETTLDTVFDRNELVLINCGDFPNTMYFTHRKGWICHNHQLYEEGYLKDLKLKGLKKIIIMKSNPISEGYFNMFPLVLENEYYSVYAIN